MINIHSQLLHDCRVLGRFKLCFLLLMRDANYPWFILVPDRDGIREIHELAEADQQQLLAESTLLARGLTELFVPDKLNIAALGNVVPQLHIHHIVRYRDDPAWPAPVWGKLPARAYREDELERVTAKMEQYFAGQLQTVPGLT